MIFSRPVRLAVTTFLLASTLVGQVFSQDLLSPAGRPDRPAGSADAPVTLIEYSSPTCGHCVTYHRDVAPVIKADYVDTGKVRLLFRPFARNPVDAAIFMLAEAQPDANYDRVVDAFYQRHEELVSAPNVKAKLAEIAASVGIEQAAFEAILADEGAFTPIQALATQAIEDLGLEGTPTFFVNDEKIVGGISATDMSALIEAKLATN